MCSSLFVSSHCRQILEILCCKLNDFFWKKDCQNSKINQFYNSRENRISRHGSMHGYLMKFFIKKAEFTITEKKIRNFPNLFCSKKRPNLCGGVIESLLCSMWGPLGEEQQRPQNINLRGGESELHMNKVTLFCMHNFEFVLCYYGFGEAARFLGNIKLATGLQMAAVQKCFCTASCIIFLPYLPSARLIFSPPKKWVMPRHLLYHIMGTTGYIIC